MERRLFLQSAALSLPALLPAADVLAKLEKKKSKQFYELREYQLTSSESIILFETYLSTALIPAVNRHGSQQVGVFRENGKPENLKRWVLITHANANAYFSMAAQLKNDEAYQQVARSYNSLPKTSAVYSRYSTTLMLAFDIMPALKATGTGNRIFELRTYEGFSDDAVRRKISMFNDHEVPIFLRAGLVPVFFGEVVAGPAQPCLLYMITTPDVGARDAGWKKFTDDAEWKVISAMPEYADSVSKVISILLEPATISQI